MMGHHIDKEGRFQSDKYPELAPDKIVLSFKDRHAQIALGFYAVYCGGDDPELAADIQERLRSIAVAESAASSKD